MCDECDELRERVAALEETVESLVEYKGGDGLGDMFIDGQPVGRVADRANQKADRAIKLSEQGDNTSGSSMSAAARDAMLPAHRMWADVRTGAENGLIKKQRRAATIFGAFVQKATDKTENDRDALEFNRVTRDGVKYVLTSTEAKALLENADTIDAGTLYASQLGRVFRDVQRLTKDECDCDSIDSCGHGLVLFDCSQGTNKLVVNKARFEEYLESVRDAAAADDDVIPEEGSSEAAADEEPDVQADVVEDEDLDSRFKELTHAHPDNNVVSKVEAKGVSTDGGERNRSSDD